MQLERLAGGVVVLLVAALGLLVTGCAKERTAKNTKHGAAELADAKKSDKKDQDHSGWWCDEHGVPEDICGQCSAKAAAECKKRGDWCKEHDRPDSQCFVCHPELEARFAAQYEAKYGKKPPRPEMEEKR